MHMDKKPVPFSVQCCHSGTCVTMNFGVTTIHLHRDDFQMLLQKGWQVLLQAEELRPSRQVGHMEDSGFKN